MLRSRKYFQELVSSVTSLSICLFIQISIRFPRNTESICSPVIKLKGTFGESEILLSTSSFIFLLSFFLLRKQCLLSVAALTSLDSARASGTGSCHRCFPGQNLVTVRRWHLFQVAQPFYSTLQCARSTSPINCTGSQGMCTQIHLLGQISRAIHQAASSISSEHDFPEQLQG